MATNTYMEEELKKLLKTLFAEKKRVKDLQKQLDEKGLQKKFHSKLSEVHKTSIDDDYTHLKNAYVGKESECLELREKLEKVRPALKKLVDELKSTRQELDDLRHTAQQTPWQQEEWLGKLSEAHKKIDQFKEENERLLTQVEEGQLFRKELIEVREELNGVKGQCTAFELEKKTLSSTLADLNKLLEQTQAQEHKETGRFEAERSRLVERLADALSQVQRQNEIIKDLRGEISILQRDQVGEGSRLKQYEDQIAELKEGQKGFAQISEENIVLKHQFAQVQEACAAQAKECEGCEAQLQLVTKQLEEANAQLQETDLAAVRKEYEAKLDEGRNERELAKNEYAALTEQLHKALEEKEKLLEKSYTKMRELSSRHSDMVEELEKIAQLSEEKQQHFIKLEKELAATQTSLQNVKVKSDERDAEIRKAQQHLAKKVKESTILRDLADRQEAHLAELQETVAKQNNELERLQNNLVLQQKHEEKLQVMAKERTQSAEVLAKEWQEKYLILQQDWQEKKGQLHELHKMREEYDKMSATVSSLKNILGKK